MCARYGNQVKANLLGRLLPWWPGVELTHMVAGGQQSTGCAAHCNVVGGGGGGQGEPADFLPERQRQEGALLRHTGSSGLIGARRRTELRHQNPTGAPERRGLLTATPTSSMTSRGDRRTTW